MILAMHPIVSVYLSQACHRGTHGAVLNVWIVSIRRSVSSCELLAELNSCGGIQQHRQGIRRGIRQERIFQRITSKEKV